MPANPLSLELLVECALVRRQSLLISHILLGSLALLFFLLQFQMWQAYNRAFLLFHSELLSFLFFKRIVYLFRQQE